MRERIFAILDNKDENVWTKSYNFLMLLTILVSIFPLMFKAHLPIFIMMDYVTAGIFSLDYILRLLTADLKLERGKLSFFLYPFTPMAIIDLLCILPTFWFFNSGFKLLKVLRMGRMLRVFKIIRHSKNIQILSNVISQQKDALMLVGGLVVGYIVFTALLLFNTEPETFETFFDAIYWATISLTTVGYGDIFATTFLGKMITMISSILGIAIVALPAGIITAGYMKEITKEE